MLPNIFLSFFNFQVLTTITKFEYVFKVHKNFLWLKVAIVLGTVFCRDAPKSKKQNSLLQTLMMLQLCNLKKCLICAVAHWSSTLAFRYFCEYLNIGQNLSELVTVFRSPPEKLTCFFFDGVCNIFLHASFLAPRGFKFLTIVTETQFQYCFIFSELFKQ